MSDEEDGGRRGQYRLAVEEYRFQVDLNWRRSEYFFVLNIGVLIAAATLLSTHKVPWGLVALLFVVGALLASLSILANHTQHGYYKSARDLKGELEKELDLDDVAIATTPGMGGAIKRLGKVGTFLTIMLVAIAIVDLSGAGIAGYNGMASAESRPGEAVVLVRLSQSSSTEASAQVVVASRDGEVVQAREVKAGGGVRPFRLSPGLYQFWTGGRAACHRPVAIGDEPLAIAKLSC